MDQSAADARATPSRFDTLFFLKKNVRMYATMYSLDLTGRCIKSHCVSTWDKDYNYPDLGACWLSSCHTSCRILAQQLKAAHLIAAVPPSLGGAVDLASHTGTSSTGDVNRRADSAEGVLSIVRLSARPCEREVQ